MKPTEQRLAERLKRDETAALEEVIDGFSGYVCTVIRNFLRGAFSAQDIDGLCADTFYALWRCRNNPEPALGLKAYLSAAARNAVKSRLRTQKPPLEDISELELADDFSVEKAVEHREMMLELYKALETLSAEEREIFIRFYFYGEKSSDISKKQE